MHQRVRFSDLLIGGTTGLIVGAIVAVNVVIFSGMEDGYEASIPEVFRQNWLIGLVVVALFAMGPIVGYRVARRLHIDRDEAARHLEMNVS